MNKKIYTYFFIMGVFLLGAFAPLKAQSNIGPKKGNIIINKQQKSATAKQQKSAISKVASAPLIPTTFTTVWDPTLAKVDGNGLVTDGKTLRFHAAGTGTVNYTITNNSTGVNTSSTFATTAAKSEIQIPISDSTVTYTLAIFPTNFTAFDVNSGLDFNGIPATGDLRDNSSRITDISQWGDVNWSTMSMAFYNASNLQVSATDMPNLSGLTDITAIFTNCTFTGPANIGSWDVSHVTNMSFALAGTSNFNIDITGWDTSNVTNMYGMFMSAYAFTQNVSSWNTSKVTDMAWMFSYNSIYNQPVNFDTSNVTTMEGMFYGATAFNNDISTFNTSKVTDMSQMFSSTWVFNQDISGWDVSKVTKMYGMFLMTKVFNQNIGSWNVSNVTDMRAMFNSAYAFNQNLGAWTFNSNVDLGYMLANYTGFDICNYSATLEGWAGNSNTPSGLSLGVNGLYNKMYDTNGAIARAILIGKGWTISGDSPSGTTCGFLGTANATKNNVEIYKDATDFIIKGSENILKVELYDMSGKLVNSVNKNAKEIKINHLSLNKGIYIVRATTAKNAVVTKKVIK